MYHAHMEEIVGELSVTHPIVCKFSLSIQSSCSTKSLFYLQILLKLDASNTYFTSILFQVRDHDKCNILITS